MFQTLCNHLNTHNIAGTMTADASFHALHPKMPGRRDILKGTVALSALLAVPLRVAASEGTAFSFDALIDRQRDAAAKPYAPADTVSQRALELDYDAYRLIQFRNDRSVHLDVDGDTRLQAFHPGWLFETAVKLHIVEDGISRPMEFDWKDFDYRGKAEDWFPEDAEFPGVAGFRLSAPLHPNDRLSEVVSFLGASYFRALGRGTVYGLSARGLAINTAISGEEEFPNFTEFWVGRRGDQDGPIEIYAALDSPSVTGAFQFLLHPGETTVVDVAQHLFFREDVPQLGVAPLTSMYLFGPNDPGPFNDFRARVHDSETLMVASKEHSFVRPLTNPDLLANSYIGVTNPTAFGLEQRTRDFDAYLDTHARYEARPSLIVEPMGDWGQGAVRLIEIPTEVESNDNIVAFWVPQAPARAGDALQFAYRLHWGLEPAATVRTEARLVRTLTGYGGVAGIAPERDRQKFVIDFDAHTMPDLPDGAKVRAQVVATSGDIAETVLERIDAQGLWRLVIEFRAAEGASVSELKAALFVEESRVSETWLYQWQTN